MTERKGVVKHEINQGGCMETTYAVTGENVDYISRQAAIDYPLSWEHYDKENGSRKFICGVESYREYIEYLPAADVVEVVRCKDCKYWQDQMEDIVEVPICARTQSELEEYPLVMIIGEDGYCSFGERTDK